ncbi:MAG: hypothetical protein DRN65_03375 [Thaumarchaeota archaeon]|nr:MAG: hypothetical protein DRN65_03375 [Nitrososphaerota archaeon]
MNKVKSKLRKGIEELDEEIRRIRSQYLTGDLSLREYLNQRGALEVEKVKRVLENLRSLHKGG